ncbi:UDP-galactose transporter-like protein [Smittium culicis]|uniref:UDP-galactose transporter homolog 1 n=1 Tax=Smittium culicis TaxID=133412 RepID=A0A1R1YJZ9_9FUNG|nr:UDP-galactose transporter-like protein [Smittium culicis]OMJ20579.1 UDP-galactose transporter-like protein [Smittium culicis]OMJ27247.1 UDP-galactose transporter-like protein [Smittium culicis]
MLPFAFNIAGVYVCFLTWGLTQEKVASTKYGEGEKFKHFLFLNMVQALIASLVGYVYSVFILKDPKIQLTTERCKNFFKVGLLSAIASPFGYASLKHIDYLTLTLAKSSKLIPVMVMHKILYRRTFPFYKYVVVSAITLGVFGFMALGPKKASASGDSLGLSLANVFGLLLVFINLSIDGALNSTQDNIIESDKKINGRNMMIYMNLATGLLYMLYLINPYSSELSSAISFLSRNPAAVWDILIFAACGSIGQCFIFHMLGNYGSLTLVTVTVTRKLFTMLLSVFLYNHVLSVGQWFSIALVFSAIIYEVYVKMSTPKTKTKSLPKSKIEEIPPFKNSKKSV